MLAPPATTRPLTMETDVVGLDAAAAASGISSTAPSASRIAPKRTMRWNIAKLLPCSQCHVSNEAVVRGAIILGVRAQGCQCAPPGCERARRRRGADVGGRRVPVGAAGRRGAAGLR